MIFRPRLLTPLLVGVLLAGGSTAFLATNTQPVSGEGVSNQVVDGYAISGIHYGVAVDPPPTGPSHLDVYSVTFTATEAAGGELQAQQGFARLDPPNSPMPPPGPQWTTCGIIAYPSSTSTTFKCIFSPGVQVNGPGPMGVGWIDSLELEVNQ
ncbi:MAG: hypothetical protein M0Z88_09040 [Actinomycetota bacterium]|nr:hypothetical protein [Actinomycetota bacterium]MDA8396491.1 hypothetical protein [Actinomycetota bacterium]